MASSTLMKVYTNVTIPGLFWESFGGTFLLDREVYLRPLTSVPQLSIQFGPDPTQSGPYPGRWVWDTHQSNSGAIGFTLTDPYGVENDTNKTFISGVLLGVAGAAFIGLVEEIIRPLARSRKNGKVSDRPT